MPASVHAGRAGRGLFQHQMIDLLGTLTRNADQWRKETEWTRNDKRGRAGRPCERRERQRVSTLAG